MMNNIAYKRRSQIFWARVSLGLKISVLVIFLLIVISKKIEIISELFAPKISEYLNNYGFALENVIITGQNNIKNEEILNALNADRGTPIFSMNLREIRQEIESNPWIKSAIIERKIPSTIIVHIKEREPIAIWQLNKELFVVDRDGEILKNLVSSKYPNLLHVVGDDANIYVSKLIEDISTNPLLAKKIVNAVRYGQRRWDLNFSGNLNVKMPQDNFLKAYQYLVELDKENKLFNQKIKSIDLRDIDKTYITRE
ncbi:MAG: FtsQ-type POTRA domain-containing protein [Rickettsiaceae bacterium]|nr:FtsQ-type POTRA domain-containing protein [Rickettsiaceae bacterium]